MNRTGVLRTASVDKLAKVKSAKRLKTSQRAVTAEEKKLWSQMAALGCIACLQDGIKNTHVSIHHIDGRTKPSAHKKVLPLCAAHHQQDDADPMQRVAVHPNKARFEAQYGTQIELLHQVMLLIVSPA
jgi:hypothetical protein